MPLIFPPAQIQEAPNATQPAKPPLALDLAGALNQARAENPLLRGAKARVEERQGLVTTARADALPQLNLTADVGRARDTTLIALAPLLGVGTETLGAPSNTYFTQVSLTQPLFYWGKLGTAIDIAHMGEEQAGLAYTTAELDILHAVAKAYINVLATQADLEVVSARLKTAEQFLADVESKVEAQTATELDRLRAESEYLGVLPDNLQAEANHQRALEVLNGTLGLDPRTPLELAELGEPRVDRPAAAGVRSEIADYLKQEEMYRANQQIITSDLRPKLDLGATYGYTTSAFHDQVHEPYDNWKVHVTLKVPLFDGLRTSGKRAQNTAQLEQVRQLRIDKERGIAVEKRTAEREVQKSLAFQDAARKAHDAGMEALRVSRESFDQGLITSLDLLQQERTERQLESQRRRADLNVWTAVLDYRRSLGLPPL
jgi:outer membrane protein TolC